MLALSHFVLGIVTIHIMWFVAYVAGTFLDRKARATSPASALAELVVRSCTGVALLGFATFALGVLGILDARGIILIAVLLLVVGRCLHGPAFFRADYWHEHAARVGAAFTGPTLGLYYIGLAVSVPAIYPDATSDGVRYHLAYAMDWARHGSLYTDHFLRYPFYANNFLLIYALFDILSLDAYVHFAVWLTGLFAMLATRAALGIVDETLAAPRTRAARIGRGLVTFLLPASITLCPAFLRWDSTGMLDAAIEAFVFIPALCAVLALSARRDLRWSAACCAGFAIGLKVSLIVLVPLFAGLIWVVVAASGGTRRACTVAVVTMLLLGTPWYLRNTVLTHDPIPPILTFALHHKDSNFTKSDWRGVLQDLGGDKRAATIALLPWRAWADPLDPRLREFGTVGLYVFLYVPFIFVAAGFMFGLRSPSDRALVAVSATAAYAVLYCFATSYLLRYLTIAQPALAASVGAALLLLPGRAFSTAAQATVAVFALLPSPSAPQFYRSQWAFFYENFEHNYVDENQYLDRMLVGYEQSRRVFGSPAFARRNPPRVLLVRVETEYYFRRAGIETVGDWFGPGRYADLVTALENDRFGDYVRHFDIGGIVVARGRGALDSTQFAMLRRSATQHGFRTIEDDTNFYVSVR